VIVRLGIRVSFSACRRKLVVVTINPVGDLRGRWYGLDRALPARNRAQCGIARIPKLFLQECQLTGRHVLAVALHLSQGFGREQMA
jgi:hypothetical protein